MSGPRTITIEVDGEFADGGWPQRVELQDIETGDKAVFGFAGVEYDE